MEEYWTTILAMVVGLSIVYYCFIWENYFEKHGIPHEKPLLIFGNMARVIFRRDAIVDHMLNIYNLNKDAKYVGMYDFNDPIIMLRDLELIKNVAVKNFHHFTNHHNFTDPDREPLFGNNLFFLRDDEWRTIRNILSPAFTSNKMKTLVQLMSKCAETFSNSLEEQCDNKSVQFNSKDIFSRYTNDAIAISAFGISVNSVKNPNNEFYNSGSRATSFYGIKLLKFFAVRVFPKLSNILRLKLIDIDVENFFYKLIRETVTTRDEQAINRPDMIQLMMETRSDKTDSKIPELSIKTMTAQAFIFFFGGFETTATTMCFAAHQLATSPEIQKKLQTEIDQVMASCNGVPTYEAINNMEYLDAVINETLRMYPVAFLIDRRCTKSFELPPPLPGGKPVMLEPGDKIWYILWAIQRDPKNFPNPDEFNPERFLGDAKANSSFNAHIPFGIGPRTCIGNRFALLEMKIMFLYLLAKFDITLGKKMTLPIKLRKWTFNVSAEGGFWINLKPRKMSH